METLVDLFDHVVRSNAPERELLRIRAGRDWRGYATQAFEEAVRRTAGRLTGAGVRAGDRVALFSENRPEWHIVDFACHLIGAVPVPLYPALPASTVAYVLKDSGARVLLVSGRDRVPPAQAAAAEVPEVRVLGLDPGLGVEPLNDLPSAAPALVRPAPGDLATLIYTSGTTGEPKGVMLTHRNLVSQLTALRPLYPITERDEVMSFLPLAHIFQRILDYLFLSCGCRITYVDAVEKAAPMLPLIRPTIIASVPRVYERAYVQVMTRMQKERPLKRALAAWALRVGRRAKAAQWRGARPGALTAVQYALARRLVFHRILERFGGRLRFTVSGGAPLAREIAEFFDIIGLPVLNGYGLTESSPVIAVNRLESNRLRSVGPAAPGVEIRIAPDGEILARGPNIMAGYWNKPEATREAIDAEGWLHTGDIGHLDADGFLYITDRKKDLLVTAGGKNVAPQPIESQLAASPFIAQAVAVGDTYPYVTALIAPNFEALQTYFAEQGINGRHSREELAAHPVTASLVAQAVKEVNARLAAYERIRRFTVLPAELTQEAGEITPTLKVRRKVVAQRYRRQIEEMYLKTHRSADYALDE
ncbi:MAG TPA: long-chain fatty acid--CoA ligase [bacterium]|nr:long-chain fatty acid--CoA ligase [bacterium]